MGRGACSSTDCQMTEFKEYKWEEIQKHNTKTDKWLVVENEVYDITEWADRHPGSSRIISHYAGQDASHAFKAFHKDLSYVKKFMKPIHIGVVEDSERIECEMDRDVEEIRLMAHKMGWYKPSRVFFALMLSQIFIYESVAIFVLYRFGNSLLPVLVSLFAMVLGQMQAGFVSHDLGHGALFKTRAMNRLVHRIIFGFGVGSATDYWNHMHNQHHCKPNVIGLDPDVRLSFMYVFGKTQPVTAAKEKQIGFPFSYQHLYLPLMPVMHATFFHLATLRHMLQRSQWVDVLFFLAFFARVWAWTTTLLGSNFAAFCYFSAFSTGFLIWFDLVSQSNHVVMDVEYDVPNKPWLQLQLDSTCNIEKSFMNDWFTGHLNHQIEHHLYPTIPRHNLYRLTPIVKSLCKKHGIEYKVQKSLPHAFADIFRAVKASGYLYKMTYESLWGRWRLF